MKLNKVKKAAAVLVTIGVITTGGIWAIDKTEEPYIEAIQNEEIVEAEVDFKDKCLVFNSLEDAEAEKLRIDLVNGYAVELINEEGNPYIYRPFGKKSQTYEHTKHPTKDKWKICYPPVHGNKYKKKNVELFDEETLGKFKGKNDAEILEFDADDDL